MKAIAWKFWTKRCLFFFWTHLTFWTGKKLRGKEKDSPRHGKLNSTSDISFWTCQCPKKRLFAAGRKVVIASHTWGEELLKKYSHRTHFLQRVNCTINNFLLTSGPFTNNSLFLTTVSVVPFSKVLFIPHNPTVCRSTSSNVIRLSVTPKSKHKRRLVPWCFPNPVSLPLSVANSNP